jgi:hypothetical protein
MGQKSTLFEQASEARRPSSAPLRYGDIAGGRATLLDNSLVGACFSC